MRWETHRGTARAGVAVITTSTLRGWRKKMRRRRSTLPTGNKEWK